MRKITALIVLGFFAFTASAQENPPPSLSEKQYVDFNDLDSAPEYPGGINAFTNEYLVPKLRKIKTKFKGKIFVSFVVAKDGNITSVKILRSDDTLLNEALVKIFNDSPKWQPGIKKDNPVECQLNLPLTFN